MLVLMTLQIHALVAFALDTRNLISIIWAAFEILFPLVVRAYSTIT